MHLQRRWSKHVFRSLHNHLALPITFPMTVKEQSLSQRRPWRSYAEAGYWFSINYDDIDSFRDLGSFIPDGVCGSVLITSRHLGTDDLVSDPRKDVCEVEGLEEDSAQDLLMRMSGSKSVADQEHAPSIVSKISCHALAIIQAASFIRRRRIRLSDFLTHYDRSRRNILQHTPTLSQYTKSLSSEGTATALNVFTTWELSFEQLRNDDERGEAEGMLLKICAFLGGTEMSEKLIRTYFENGEVRYPHIYCGEMLQPQDDTRHTVCGSIAMTLITIMWGNCSLFVHNNHETAM